MTSSSCGLRGKRTLIGVMVGLVCVAAPVRGDGRPNGTVNITEGANVVKVDLLADDVVHIRLGPGGVFPHDDLPEYVVVKPDAAWRPPRTTVRTTAKQVTITTAKARLEFTRHPLTLTIRDAQRHLILGGYVVDFNAPTPRIRFALAHHEHLYGFGDKRAALDKRGQLLDLWNRDAFASKGNESYKNIPFYMSTAGYGLFLHNIWRSHFDMGATHPKQIDIAAEGGPTDFYLFLSPSLKRIVQRYTELTGRPAFLPRWVFGYHQGKASYKGLEARQVAARMRADRLPCDVIYYDDNGPQLSDRAFLDEMWNTWKMRITVGLGMPLAVVGTDYYKALEQRGFLMTDVAGTAFHYRTEEIEAEVANIDFFSKAAVDFVFDTVWKPSLGSGAQFGMIDFGELQYVPQPKTRMWPSIHRDVYEMHNLYSLVYAEQLIDRGAQFKHGRKVGFMRPGFAGSQRVGWTWTCDSLPKFEDFQAHLRGAINLTLSGFATVGYDIGGWDSKGPDNVYARWFTAGMYNPFAWSHGQGDHEPYSHGPAVEALCRAALKRRYRLIPYLYTLNYQASQTGIPMMRSLVMETEGEAGTYGIGDEFFLGPWMLVAPIVTDRDRRQIFLPAGEWIDYQDGRTRYTGPTTLSYRAALGRVPVFVKAGAILPMGPVMQYTGEKPLDPLTLDIYPHGRSSFTLFEDDGESLDYEQGNYTTTTYRCAATRTAVRVTIEPRNQHGGQFRPAKRDVILTLHRRTDTDGVVMLNGVALARGSLEQLWAGRRCWAVDRANDCTWVRLLDTGTAIEINVKSKL
jgi:alpha-glucosidase (family GH31 glycosyl hydrolase)